MKCMQKHAKASKIICKRVHKPKKHFIVPLLRRMNTKFRSVAIECKHGDVEYDRRHFAQHLSRNRGGYSLSNG